MMSTTTTFNECQCCHGTGFIKAKEKPYLKSICEECAGKGIITPILGKPMTLSMKMRFQELEKEKIDDEIAGLEEEIEEKEDKIEDLEEEISFLEIRIQELRNKRYSGGT